MNKILVLGATGNVGKHLISELLAKGEQVKAASRSGNCLEEGVEGVVFDFTDLSTHEPAFDGVDRLYMMLPSGYLQITQLLMPLIEIAKQKRIKVVMQSVLGVEADEANPYRQVEITLENSGLPFVILRPNWFADNFHTFWKAGIDHGEIALPADRGKTSFIDSRDIATSAASALTTDRFDGQSFNLTGVEALSYAQAAEVLSSVLNKPISYRHISDEAFIESLISAGVPEAYSHFLSAIFNPVREGFTSDITDAVKTLTGNAPRTLQQYCKDKIELLGPINRP
jgi:uncharacterized protein YbjT (DUF2867 family)